MVARSEAQLDQDTEFKNAQDAVKRLAKRPGNDEMLKLYALYKQASEGDVKGARPGMLQMVERAKYDAWATLKGKTQADSKQAYVQLYQDLAKKYGTT